MFGELGLIDQLPHERTAQQSFLVVIKNSKSSTDGSMMRKLRRAFFLRSREARQRRPSRGQIRGDCTKRKIKHAKLPFAA